jgi:hypothetical protein
MSEPRWVKKWAARAAVLIVLPGCVIAQWTPSEAGAATTHKVFVAPFDANGDPTIDTTRREGDSCTGSFVNGHTTAYRCFSGHFIYDPCFSGPLDDGRLLCVGTPWATEGVVLTGQEVSYPTTVARPVIWAIGLASGARCTFASGASSVRAGLRLNYFCSGRRRTLLWGSPNRQRATWTIRMSHGYTGRGWRRVKIAVAWS